jgi:hypothetical protein
MRNLGGKVQESNRDATGQAAHDVANRAQRGHLSEMIRPTMIEALPGFRLRLHYADGVEGVIDLSKDVGRGVFGPLAEESFFRTVRIGEFGQIAWSGEIEICPDAAYQEIVDSRVPEPTRA